MAITETYANAESTDQVVLAHELDAARAHIVEVVRNPAVPGDKVEQRIVNYVNLFQQVHILPGINGGAGVDGACAVKKELSSLYTRAYTPPTYEEAQCAVESYLLDEQGRALFDAGVSAMPRATSMVLFDEIFKMLGRA